MKDNVVSFEQEKKEKENTSSFLDILDKDIEAGNVKKIPQSIFDRVAKIQHAALEARQRNELIEM